MVTLSYSVSGKTAIVTGAGSGINLAFAKLLLSRGCNVVFADISLRPEAKDVIAQHQDTESRAVWVETDVTSWPAMENMFEVAYGKFGDVDIVCPGAGVCDPKWSNFWFPPGSDVSNDDVEGGRYAALDINITHPIRATQIALSYWLHPRKTGLAKASPTNPKRIIHVSSIAAQVPALWTPMYSAAKHAISGFVRSLAGLEASHGIRVNAVAPGLVHTPLWLDRAEMMQLIDSSTDAWVTPQEVAVAMLRCAEEEKLVGGTVLEVGASNTREVQPYNDPGPSQKMGSGHVISNAKHVVGGEVARFLADERLWGQRGT